MIKKVIAVLFGLSILSLADNSETPSQKEEQLSQALAALELATKHLKPSEYIVEDPAIYKSPAAILRDKANEIEQRDKDIKEINRVVELIKTGTSPSRQILKHGDILVLEDGYSLTAVRSDPNIVFAVCKQGSMKITEDSGHLFNHLDANYFYSFYHTNDTIGFGQYFLMSEEFRKLLKTKQ